MNGKDFERVRAEMHAENAAGLENCLRAFETARDIAARENVSPAVRVWIDAVLTIIKEEYTARAENR